MAAKIGDEALRTAGTVPIIRHNLDVAKDEESAELLLARVLATELPAILVARSVDINPVDHHYQVIRMARMAMVAADPGRITKTDDDERLLHSPDGGLHIDGFTDETVLLRVHTNVNLASDVAFAAVSKALVRRPTDSSDYLAMMIRSEALFVEGLADPELMVPDVYCGVEEEGHSAVFRVGGPADVWHRFATAQQQIGREFMIGDVSYW